MIIKLPNKENYNLLLFLIASIVIASSIFLIIDNEQWKFHTNVGLDRMIYKTCGFYILIISQNLHITLSKIFNIWNDKS